jgi:predicted RNA-binding Zn-ribbon protein involved in translation (DUF1610 family)
MWYAGVVESLFEAAATGRAMAKGRSLSQFQETFPDEASCAAFLLERRWSKGFVCPGCGEQRAAGRCHGASGLRSHWRLGSQGDEENQLHRAPVSA